MSCPEPRDISAIANRLFAEHETIDWPAEDWELLDALSRMPSPWLDSDRSRWIVSDLDQIYEVLGGASYSNRLGAAADGTRSRHLLDRIGSYPPSMLFTDAPQHSAVRRAVAPHFRRDAVAALEHELRAGLRQRWDACPVGEPFDLGSAVVGPVLARTVLAAVDFDRDAYPDLFDEAFVVNRLFDLTCSETEVAVSTAARQRMRAFIGDQLDRQRAGAGRPALAWDAAGVDRETQISNVEAILRAGVVNTGALLLNLAHLCLTSAEAAALLEQGAGTPDARAERLMLLASPVLDAGRVTTAETVLGSVAVPPGQTLICLIGSGNRRNVTDPRHLMPNVIFGGGRHVCLGAPLVRTAVRCFVDLLATGGRVCEPAGEPQLHRTPSFRGICVLPVRRLARAS